MNTNILKIPFTIKITKDLKNLVTEYCEREGYIISAFVEKALKRQIQEEAETNWAMKILEERMDEETIQEEDMWRELKKLRKDGR
jgi:hypothetical protein